LVIYTL
jgi:hypothetical protein